MRMRTLFRTRGFSLGWSLPLGVGVFPNLRFPVAGGGRQTGGACGGYPRSTFRTDLAGPDIGGWRNDKSLSRAYPTPSRIMSQCLHHPEAKCLPPADVAHLDQEFHARSEGAIKISSSEKIEPVVMVSQSLAFPRVSRFTLSNHTERNGAFLLPASLDNPALSLFAVRGASR
jgi:hypothetical protein